MGNYTLLTNENVTHIGEIVSAASAYTGGLLGVFFLVSTFIVTFIILGFTFSGSADNRQAFAASGFITALISIMLMMLDIIPPIAMFICIVLSAASFVWLLMNN